MNVLTAIVLDFAAELKKRTKGWQITPLVTKDEHRGRYSRYVFFKPRPSNTAPTDFYADNQAESEDTAYLLIKQSNRPLRVVRLSLEMDTACMIKVHYWRANGHAAPQCNVRFARYRIDPPDGWQALRLIRIFRITKTNKGIVYHDDQYNPAIKESLDHLLPTVIATIDRSFSWHGRGKRETFDKYADPLRVDINGRNFVADERHAP